MQVNLSREKGVQISEGGQEEPAHVRIEGDSEGGQCWVWLMFSWHTRKAAPTSPGWS